MSDQIRFIIDYASGEVWVMPLELFENYERFCASLQAQSKEQNLTPIAHLLCYATLREQQRALIEKKARL